MLPAASKQPMPVSVFDAAELVGFRSPEASCGCAGGIASKHVGIDQAIVAEELTFRVPPRQVPLFAGPRIAESVQPCHAD